MAGVAMRYSDESFAANAVKSDREAHSDFIRYGAFQD
jgi:hypothetical protein